MCCPSGATDRSNDVVYYSWGIPYGAVMMGAKLVFPGPHLHPNDLLYLIQAEPPTITLGVPTIRMGLIQTCEQALATEPGPCTLPRSTRTASSASPTAPRT